MNISAARRSDVARPDEPKFNRARPRFQVRDQLGHRIDRQRRVDDQHVAELGGERDLDQIAAHVERKIVAHQRRNDLAAEPPTNSV